MRECWDMGASRARVTSPQKKGVVFYYYDIYDVCVFTIYYYLFCIYYLYTTREEYADTCFEIRLDSTPTSYVLRTRHA